MWFLRGVLAGVLSLVLTTAGWTNEFGIPLAPGERLVAVNGVPVAAAGLSSAAGAGSVAMAAANAARRRRGQGPLREDPGLMRLALQKARQAAGRGHKGHVGGSLGGARCEGVGWTQGEFLSCCLDTPGSVGGAASVRGRDGWYHCLLVR